MDVSLSELREMVMDRKAWHAVIHGVAKSWTQLSDWTELKTEPPELKLEAQHWGASFPGTFLDSNMLVPVGVLQTPHPT